MVAACDTFRAGAVEQLEMWANRAEVSCYTPSEERKSPSAVLYGALEQARNEKYDTLIVDTSGRLSNNDALNQELLKMKRVIQKYMSTQRDEDNKPIPNLTLPHEILLVIDAAQGRMALDSAKQWDDLLQLSGLVLTKLDGSAKGGSVVAVWRELGVPVKLVGVGEGIEDLRDVSDIVGVHVHSCTAYFVAVFTYDMIDAGTITHRYVFFILLCSFHGVTLLGCSHYCAYIPMAYILYLV